MRVLTVTAGLGNRQRLEIENRIERAGLVCHRCRDIYDLCARALSDRAGLYLAAVLLGIADQEAAQVARLLTRRFEPAVFLLCLPKSGYQPAWQAQKAGAVCLDSLDGLEFELKKQTKRFDEMYNNGSAGRPDNLSRQRGPESMTDSMTLSKDELDAILGAG